MKHISQSEPTIDNKLEPAQRRLFSRQLNDKRQISFSFSLSLADSIARDDKEIIRDVVERNRMR